MNYLYFLLIFCDDYGTGLKKCDYKPDNKNLYGSHLVDNSWGKV